MKDKIKHKIVEEKSHIDPILFFILHLFSFGVVFMGITCIFIYIVLSSIQLPKEKIISILIHIWILGYGLILYAHRKDFKPVIIKTVEHEIE